LKGTSDGDIGRIEEKKDEGKRSADEERWRFVRRGRQVVCRDDACRRWQGIKNEAQSQAYELGYKDYVKNHIATQMK